MEAIIGKQKSIFKQNYAGDDQVHNFGDCNIIEIPQLNKQIRKIILNSYKNRTET